MPKLPQVSGKQVVKALERYGFVKVSQKGSHIKLRKTTAKRKITIIVPDHKKIRKGTLKNGILNAIPLTVSEFNKLLKK